MISISPLPRRRSNSERLNSNFKTNAFCILIGAICEHFSSIMHRDGIIQGSADGHCCEGASAKQYNECIKRNYAMLVLKNRFLIENVLCNCILTSVFNIWRASQKTTNKTFKQQTNKHLKCGVFCMCYWAFWHFDMRTGRTRVNRTGRWYK